MSAQTQVSVHLTTTALTISSRAARRLKQQVNVIEIEIAEGLESVMAMGVVMEIQSVEDENLV